MGLDTLIMAGSHGFDKWSPDGGTIPREEGTAFSDLLHDVSDRMYMKIDPIAGTAIEPMKPCVAVHYRLVAAQEWPRVTEVIDASLAAHPEQLQMTPDKMVDDIQPKLNWNKGKAVTYLLDALDFGHDDVMPISLGDDITNEHACGALGNRGIGIFVGRADDSEVAERTSAADNLVHSTDEGEPFLLTLAQAAPSP
jgi:trehalose 6-phosphate phosphatase